MKNLMGQSLRWLTPPVVPKTLTTDSDKNG